MRESSGKRAAWEKRLKDKAAAAEDFEEQTRRLLERERGVGTTGTGTEAGTGAGKGMLLDGGGLADAVYDLKRQLADIEVRLEEAEARKRSKQQQSGSETTTTTTTTRGKATIPDTKKDKSDPALSSFSAAAAAAVAADDSAASVWQLAERGREQVLTAWRDFTSKTSVSGRDQDGVSSVSLNASSSSAPVTVPIPTQSSHPPSSTGPPRQKGKNRVEEEEEEEDVEKPPRVALALRLGRVADRVTGWFRRIWGGRGGRGKKSGEDRDGTVAEEA